MLSSIDIPSLYAFQPMDPEPSLQNQHHQEYFVESTTTTTPPPPSSSLPANEEAHVQDKDPHTVAQLTKSHIEPLIDLHMHFQDLPIFIHHPDFDHFAYCWMESQYYVELSKHVECRPTAMAWFASSSLQLACIVSNYPPCDPSKEDAEASTPHIKAAYQRLVHYFNVMHKVIDTIEKGRLANRSPQEIMLPIFHQLLEKSFNQQEQSINTLPPPPPPPIFGHRDALTYDSPSSPAVPGVSMSIPPSLNHSDASTPQAPSWLLDFPPNHQNQPSYEYLSLSNPVTPDGIDTLSSMFWTYPISTDQHQHQHQQQSGQSSSMSSFDSLSTSPAETIKNEEESESTPMQLDAYPHYLPHTLEGSTPEDQDSDYQHTSMDEEEEEEDDDDDDDYYEDDEGDDWGNHILATRPTKKRDNAAANDSCSTTTTTPPQTNCQHHQCMESKDKTPVTPRSHIPRRGRTATSYDDETTHFLKTMFFNIYSQRDKLTKDQRRQVVEKTGLKPRNVTYWFSNHKRRFQAALDVFKKLVAESNGRIQTYDDFIQWRRENGLPEDITDNRT